MSIVHLQKASLGSWENCYLPAPLSSQEEKRLFQRLEINFGDKKVKDEIVERNTILVRSLAKKRKNSYPTPGLELGDLCQEGVIGLMKALDKFDLKRGNKFFTYAIPWINQAIIRSIKNKSRTIRIPINETEMITRYKKTEAKLYQELKRFPSNQEIADEMKIKEKRINLLKKIKDDAISLDASLSGDREKDALIYFVKDEKIDSPSSRIEEEELREKLKEILSSCLNPKEKKILIMRFGLENETRHTLEEAGKIFHITKERVRQIQKRALKRLSQNPELKELLK